MIPGYCSAQDVIEAAGWGEDKLYPFSADVSLEKTASQKGTVEVFGISIFDGSEIYKITIPVEFIF